ncbi:hypothetical protein [Albibacterium indicum]|uniref:hypothetical protein n=1 Tax=Albibacterium indicum TaxID=2292082 RepID=UPI000E4A87AB|nr:hypothetical protein [Pedobacter indicus]
MEAKFYNPFEDFTFDTVRCFLTGEKLEDPLFFPVFPKWILKDYGLEDMPFKMLDENVKRYSDLTLPCCQRVYDRLEALDKQAEEAFKGGYKDVSRLDSDFLFQWIAKWVYGIIFNEIQVGIRQQVMSGEPLNFSQTLMQKFRNLHTMLQSLIHDVEFENQPPYSILIFEVDNPENTYNYRDEINTLVFSLRIKDLGIIACLQDNEANLRYHQEALDDVWSKKLHPIQFEELCARFFYSCYLFNRLPDYMVTSLDEKIFIEPMSLLGVNSRPVFDQWQSKTYGQVLENFWKPWGYTLFEIIKDPENPMSFIYDGEKNVMSTDQINLPKG